MLLPEVWNIVVGIIIGIKSIKEEVSTQKIINTHQILFPNNKEKGHLEDKGINGVAINSNFYINNLV
jgi:hypothetical protein